MCLVRGDLVSVGEVVFVNVRLDRKDRGIGHLQYLIPFLISQFHYQ